MPVPVTRYQVPGAELAGTDTTVPGSLGIGIAPVRSLYVEGVKVPTVPVGRGLQMSDFLHMSETFRFSRNTRCAILQQHGISR